MKMLKALSVVCVTVSAILMMAGCQSSKSEISKQAVEPSTELEKGAVDTSTVKGQEPAGAKEVVAEAEKTPKIVLTKETNDFGEVGPKSKHVADYEFVNKGNAALLVNNVQSTCGCSKPVLMKDGIRHSVPLKEPVPFEPGQSGRVEVTFTAGSTKGAVKKHLYILTNDPVTPRAQLEVKANVVTKVSVAPESVDLLLDQDNAGMPELVVQSEDGKEFSIRSITVANKTIDVPFDATEKATKFVLHPKVDIQKLEQFSTGVVQISTDHPQGGTLMVRYNAKPIYEVSNPRYILQNIVPGESVLRENLIRSNYGKVAEIDSVTSRNGYMEIESQEQEGNHIKLMIKITPPAQGATQRRYISDELTITLKGGHKLKIRCSGWFRMK
ncbi:MAG: DUF1573 domain-containing protein [Planctomycetota bacterium]|jgi:hypothetical protein